MTEERPHFSQGGSDPTHLLRFTESIYSSKMLVMGHLLSTLSVRVRSLVGNLLFLRTFLLFSFHTPPAPFSSSL